MLQTGDQVPTEHEIKVAPTVTQQVKLLAALRSDRVEDLIHTIKGVLGIGDFHVAMENVKTVMDDYFDTDDLALYYTHSVFRIRREGGSPRLVIKKLVGQDQGELRRTEDETELSEAQLQSLLAERFASVVRAKLTDLRDKLLSIKLRVTNERRNYIMERGQERFRLSIDIFVFTNPLNGRTSNQQFEVEIEALDEHASAKLGAIKHNFLDVLEGFAFSKGSKYERGIKLFFVDRSEWLQLLAGWSTGTGLNWTSVIIGLIGLVLTIVGLVLTWRASAGA